MSALLFALTGDPKSGKSTVGKYLETVHEFQQFSGSGYLIDEARSIGKSLKKREDYAEFQRYLRICRSFTFITDRLLEMDGNRKVNVGIRNRLDVDAHRKAGGIIVALYCPLETRFERREIGNPKYPSTLYEFYNDEAAQYEDADPFAQHTHYAMAQADHWIDTSRPKTETYEAIDEIIEYHAGQQR